MNRVSWLAACVLAGAACAAAAAPSTAGWSASDRLVAEACLAASELQKPKVVGAPMAFDDGVGYTALLIAGRHPRPQARQLSGSELCLYDRKAAKAHVTDADRMGAARE
jgi:hypothetical protein